MIAKYYGKHFSLEYLRSQSYITRQGVSMLGISEAAEQIGFRTLAAKVSYKALIEDAPFPVVLHWNQKHFVVLPDQKFNKNKITIADPAHGLVQVDKETLLRSWMGSSQVGVALLLEPTQKFYEEKGEKNEVTGFGFLFNYLKPYKRYVFQLLLSVLLGGLLSLIFPFLTQSMVDYGINRQDINYVYLILLSQLLLFLGSTVIEVIRSWILLHMNTRINIQIISDFLRKLMRLPIRFFDTKMVGDIQQRIGDHQRIQNFLTGTTLSTLFSFINLIVFAIVLAIYSIPILLLFMVFSTASIGWILFFLKRRKELDYKRFQRMTENQNTLFEMIVGMQEIKLNNCETPKRWEWERIQAKLYKISIKGLALGQYQQVGSSFFNQLKNILISFVSATAVMKGEMTLGMMLAVSYIIGQMNGPLEQLLGFVQAAQDAKISLDRLGEIHNKPDEANELENVSTTVSEKSGSINLENISFQYEGPHSPYVLKDINLSIPEGKVTAIVGSSGSGKTTLMKLLLQFYEPVRGEIKIGKKDFKQIAPNGWRSKVGTVMQEGIIFSDTIAKNISISDENPDYQKLDNAVKVANIKEFIDELPLGYQTKIGNTGTGISTGQKQRMQIARAVYKNPQYLFFDEATSALDANNERIIMENLEQFFEGKTVMIIAHRLSTVKHADQIIVIEKGEIVETGTHEELASQKGYYYNLVKNQLELGN
jgi:ABC-type bacteriocin/lantibiotic exporters, contain an N-terminal double-glycine peptidase domain